MIHISLKYTLIKFSLIMKRNCHSIHYKKYRYIIKSDGWVWISIANYSFLPLIENTSKCQKKCPSTRPSPPTYPTIPLKKYHRFKELSSCFFVLQHSFIYFKWKKITIHFKRKVKKHPSQDSSLSFFFSFTEDVGLLRLSSGFYMETKGAQPVTFCYATFPLINY